MLGRERLARAARRVRSPSGCRSRPARSSRQAARIGQIVSHLLSNAIKFTAEGEVGVTLARRDHPPSRRHRPGEAATVRALLIEPFRQGETGATRLWRAGPGSLGAPTGGTARHRHGGSAGRRHVHRAAAVAGRQTDRDRRHTPKRFCRAQSQHRGHVQLPNARPPCRWRTAARTRVADSDTSYGRQTQQRNGVDQDELRPLMTTYQAGSLHAFERLCARCRRDAGLFTLCRSRAHAQDLLRTRSCKSTDRVTPISLPGRPGFTIAPRLVDGSTLPIAETRRGSDGPGYRCRRSRRVGRASGSPHARPCSGLGARRCCITSGVSASPRLAVASIRADAAKLRSNGPWATHGVLTSED